VERIKTVMLAVLVTFCLFLNSALGSDNAEQLVLGNHVLTLQWLLNHGGIGKAKIYKKDGKIFIDGYQEEKYKGDLNYMTIQGTITIRNPKELEFEGKIITKINYLNSGISYERNGKFLLKAWGARKYWRMQNMTQPDGEYKVTDYIDIYFEKYR
jgi:hypothetical protein